MDTDVSDLRSTIIPKSDQLNAEQLLGGPMIITVSDVRAGSGDDQPVSLFYALDPGRPFKPCKTMRKLLIHAWGPDGRQWIGRSLELFNEPTIKFGGETVGGIRISRMSHIGAKGIEVSLTQTRGRKTLHKVTLLKSSPELTAALEAIEAITDKASQQHAKALAGALKAAADRESALAAYKRKVESLKAATMASDAASVSGASAFDLAAFVKRVEDCTDLAMLQILNDETESMPDGDDKVQVLAAIIKRDAELGDQP